MLSLPVLKVLDRTTWVLVEDRDGELGMAWFIDMIRNIRGLNSKKPSPQRYDPYAPNPATSEELQTQPPQIQQPAPIPRRPPGPRGVWASGNGKDKRLIPLPTGNEIEHFEVVYNNTYHVEDPNFGPGFDTQLFNAKKDEKCPLLIEKYSESGANVLIIRGDRGVYLSDDVLPSGYSVNTWRFCGPFYSNPSEIYFEEQFENGQRKKQDLAFYRLDG
jgi:hypothetical protein